MCAFLSSTLTLSLSGWIILNLFIHFYLFLYFAGALRGGVVQIEERLQRSWMTEWADSKLIMGGFSVWSLDAQHVLDRAAFPKCVDSAWAQKSKGSWAWPREERGNKANLADILGLNLPFYYRRLKHCHLPWFRGRRVTKVAVYRTRRL